MVHSIVFHLSSVHLKVGDQYRDAWYTQQKRTPPPRHHIIIVELEKVCGSDQLVAAQTAL